MAPFTTSSNTGRNNAVAVGKTVVSSQMIDRVTASWAASSTKIRSDSVDGLLDGSLGFGERTAAYFRPSGSGSVRTTHKDEFVPALLVVERPRRGWAAILVKYTRIRRADSISRSQRPPTAEQKAISGQLSPDQVTSSELAGEKMIAKLTTGAGNGAAIGGLKVTTGNGWFAARPSGTENVYKDLRRGLRDAAHLRQLQDEAQSLVAGILTAQQTKEAATPPRSQTPTGR